jgi:hypothetical protein
LRGFIVALRVETSAAAGEVWTLEVSDAEIKQTVMAKESNIGLRTFILMLSCRFCYVCWEFELSGLMGFFV